MGEDKDKDRKKEKKLLKELLSTVHALRDEQRALHREIARLDRRVAALTGGDETEDVLAALDRYRAQEAFGEFLFGIWIEHCSDDRLRGGLRTIQMREGAHARLLEDRIRALGGRVEAEVDDAVQRVAIESITSGEADDAGRARFLVQQFPDVEKAIAPIYEMAERLGGDHETRALLETIAADERASLEFLCGECSRLNPDA
jgi:hypothetical protein